MTTLILQLNQVEELLCSDLTVDRLFCPTQQKNFLSFYSKSLNNHLLVNYVRVNQCSPNDYFFWSRSHAEYATLYGVRVCMSIDQCMLTEK